MNPTTSTSDNSNATATTASNNPTTTATINNISNYNLCLNMQPTPKDISRRIHVKLQTQVQPKPAAMMKSLHVSQTAVNTPPTLSQSQLQPIPIQSASATSSPMRNHFQNVSFEPIVKKTGRTPIDDGIQTSQLKRGIVLKKPLSPEKLLVTQSGFSNTGGSNSNYTNKNARAQLVVQNHLTNNPIFSNLTLVNTQLADDSTRPSFSHSKRQIGAEYPGAAIIPTKSRLTNSTWRPSTSLQVRKSQQQQYLDEFTPANKQSVDNVDAHSPEVISFKRLLLQQQHSRPSSQLSSAQQTSPLKQSRALLDNPSTKTTLDDHVDNLRQSNVSTVANMSFYTGGDERKKKSNTNSIVALNSSNSSSNAVSATTTTTQNSHSNSSFLRKRSSVHMHSQMRQRVVSPSSRDQFHQQSRNSTTRSLLALVSTSRSHAESIVNQSSDESPLLHNSNAPDLVNSSASQLFLHTNMPLKKYSFLHSADSSPARNQSGASGNGNSNTTSSAFHNKNILKKHHLVKNIQDISQFTKTKRSQMFHFVYESPLKPSTALRNSQINSALRCVEVYNAL